MSPPIDSSLKRKGRQSDHLSTKAPQQTYEGLLRPFSENQNFTKAFETLKKGVALEKPNLFEEQGIIQSFEFTFELAWKTLKDFLESKEVMVSYPRRIGNSTGSGALHLGDRL